jgi:transcriptional regulator with XRE-family HTH domain
MNFISLGKRIKEERNKCRLTQQQLAEEVELSDAFIGQIERGERCPTLETLISISNRLNVSVDYLLQDSANITDETIVNEWIQIMDGKTQKQKKLALELIKTLFREIDGE